MQRTPQPFPDRVRTIPQRHWSVLAGCALLILAGCSGNSAPGPGPIGPEVEPGTQHQLEVDDVPLEQVLSDVFDELEWSRVGLGAMEADEPVETRALVPDGREARIEIRPDRDAPHELTVSIRVGHFGDPHLEQQFFNTLRREIRDR